VAYLNDEPVSCGAIKKLTRDSIEVKRMYTKREHRGTGIASKILLELESWALEQGYKKCVLETGKGSRKQFGCMKKTATLLSKIMANMQA
jgi:GNAT superfamily N-acetyltransferase